MVPPTPPTAHPPHAVEVRTAGRLHLGMISFGNPAVPSFGGVGVMVEGLGVTVRVARADGFRATGPLAERAVAFARQCGRAWSLGDTGCVIDVLAAPRSHVGLGSGTQLALAVAAGVRTLLVEGGQPVRERSFTIQESLALATAAGRGRRSCVGIYGFGGGGLIAEGGRKEDDPSERFSPLVARVMLPEAWRCIVIVRKNCEGLHGEPEKQAFARLPPVPAEISTELARIAASELVPAAEQGDFAGFSDAVHRYGRLAGRPFEAESSSLSFHAGIGRLIAQLGDLGVRGAAQSSWGPAVMACCESNESAARLVDELSRGGLDADHDLAVTSFDRHGASLTYSRP
jgi:beta-RFAP synthase